MSIIIMFCHRLLTTLILTCLTYLVFGAHFHTHAKERVEDSFNSLHYDEHGKHYSDYDHQAILGSKKAAEEYGELSPEESKQRLRILVTKGGMDKNNDGYVDKSELFEWVSNSFKSLALEEGGERLAEEDMDNDGKVSWTEHINSNFDTENNFEDEEEMIHEDKELWKAADQDGDNLLDVKEFTAFYSPEEHDRMHDALYELTMQRKDKNKDGFLDFNEFISDDHGSIPDTKTETYVLEKEKFGTDYDLNHDQRLDKGEVLRWIIPDMNQSVEQEVDHLIETCDDDSDGRLSVDEIVSHYTTFVSSEATNFGDNLYETEHDEL